MGRTLFAGIGRSRTSSTTRATSRYVKTHRESAKTPASSPECAASPTISCGIINPTPSHRTAMLQLSVASIRSFQCASVKSVEQPCNRMIAAGHGAHAVRGHWAIENKLHYTRDVTLCEDASRIRKNPGIFARMRSFAYNILRHNQSDTIAQDRYAAALGGLNSLFSMRFGKER